MDSVVYLFLREKDITNEMNIFLDKKEGTKIIDVGKLFNNVSYRQKKTNVKKHIL